MILILAMFLVLNKDFKPNSSSSTEVLTYFKSLSKKKLFLNYKLKYLVKSLLTIDGPSLYVKNTSGKGLLLYFAPLFNTDTASVYLFLESNHLGDSGIKNQNKTKPRTRPDIIC